MSNRSKKAQVWILCEKEVLLFQVIEKRGGGWHPVTGGVEASESFLEGAKRELEEETGFSVNQGRFVDLEYEFQFDGRFGRATEHAFLFVLNQKQNPKLDPKEHLNARWVSLNEAIRLVQFENQREALKRVEKCTPHC